MKTNMKAKLPKCKHRPGKIKECFPIFVNNYIFNGSFTLNFLNDPSCCYCGRRFKIEYKLTRRRKKYVDLATITSYPGNIE